MGWEVFLALLHITDYGNWTPDLLILILPPSSLLHALPQMGLLMQIVIAFCHLQMCEAGFNILVKSLCDPLDQNLG